MRLHQRVLSGVTRGMTTALTYGIFSIPLYAADTVPAVAAAASATAAASTLPASPASPAGMLQVMVGLILVLVVLVVIAWAVKKIGVGKQASGGAIKIVGGLQVGNRERIMVIEVANEWIVVGVTATSITALSTMPKQEDTPPLPTQPLAKNFSAWLQHTIDKRKAAASKLPSDSDHGA